MSTKAQYMHVSNYTSSEHGSVAPAIVRCHFFPVSQGKLQKLLHAAPVPRLYFLTLALAGNRAEGCNQGSMPKEKLTSKVTAQDGGLVTVVARRK